MLSPSLPPLSLYVHIPWCVRKCPYCDFNSHEAPAVLPEGQYTRSLVADLEGDAGRAQGRKIDSVFFGGGTPSLFGGKSVASVLRAADDLVGLASAAEITLEANPGTVEQGRFAEFRQAGVNRLSIGIQSLHDAQLKALGRIHGRDEALSAVSAAREAGFDNFNLDLMHGLPEQTVAEALADLEQVIALEPAHISWYQLTIEQNTLFYSQPPSLPDSDVLAEIEDRGWELLNSAGYKQYEISAYSRAGRQSLHNRNYWEFGDYLGIGAGAHGKITDAGEGTVWRSAKTRLPAHYMTPKLANDNWSPVPHDDLPLEFMLNSLRLCDGVPSEYFAARTGLGLETLEPQLRELRNRRLLEGDAARLSTTSLGRRFLNDVLAAFMVPDQQRG